MPYTPDTWADLDPTKVVSAARMTKLGGQYTAAMADTAALYGADVRAWAPNTVYAAGQAVVSPTSGDVVTSKTAHTSSSTFSGTGAGGNWNLSPTFEPAGLSAATKSALTIAESQVTNLTSDLAAKAPTATSVPQWQPNTAYVQGQQVVSPNGDVVSAKSAFTSGASYNAANWNLSATFALQGANPNVPFYNMVPANFTKWRAALSRVRNGSGFAKLACVGDSTTWGVGSGASSAPSAGYPAQLAARLNAQFAPTALGLSIPYGSSYTDSRWSLGTGWTRVSYGFGMVTAWNAPTSATGALTYTPGINCDTFDIYYAQSSGNGTVQASVDGGANTAIVTSGSTSVGKATVTATAGSSHVLSLQTVTVGSVYIYGIEAYLSTAPSIRVGNAGAPGATTAGWSADTGFNSLVALRTYAPDLTVVSLGINDAHTPPVATATWQANMQAIITAAKASGDVILMSVVPSATSSNNLTTAEQGYQAVSLALAQQNNIGYIDLFARFGSYSTMNGLGMMYDVLHPNSLGYADMMAAVYKAVTAFG